MEKVTNTEQELRVAMHFDSFIKDSIVLAARINELTEEQVEDISTRIFANKYWDEFYSRFMSVGEPAINNFLSTQKLLEESLTKTSEALAESISSLLPSKGT